MTQPNQMPPARRRPIPGMATNAGSLPTPPSPEPEPPVTATTPPPPDAKRRSRASARSAAPAATVERPRAATAANGTGDRDRRPSVNYATTRLVNFRLPVDLHDRFRQLVHEAEQRHPQLRRPNLTELMIALLEEGPSTADEVAELIRRKRIAEHGLEL